MAKKWLPFCILLLVLALPAFGQDLPENELNVNMSGYFDNFGVAIFYPQVSISQQVSESTSLTGRYLVDVISAASMQSHFEVDGVTSATSRNSGGGDDTPDELRHEMGLGLTQMLGDATVSLNTLYSTEHDYTSGTLAGNVSYPFALKNTVLQLGIVRSWDTVSPQIREWEKDKDVLHLSTGLTQILSKRLIAQLNASFIQYDGLLSDPYQVVQIIQDGRVVNYEPIHPDSRKRRSVGVRTNYLLNDLASLHLGYRYYWDDWDVNSHTISAGYERYLHNEQLRLSVGVRSYFQSRADFFEPTYTAPAEYLTVDSKLDKGYSNEYQFNLTILDGVNIPYLNFPLADDRREFNIKLNFYHRHTDTPDWHSRYRNLFAYIVNFGIRYRL